MRENPCHKDKLNHMNVFIFIALRLFFIPSPAPFAESINPYPRPVIKVEKAREWDFIETTEGWAPQHNTRVMAQKQTLAIESYGEDPYIMSGPFKADGPLVVRFRALCQGEGKGSFYWTTEMSPQTGEDKTASFDLKHDGKWKEYAVRLDVTGVMTRLRFDPGAGPGNVELDWIRLERAILHPLEIVSVEIGSDNATAVVINHSNAIARYTSDVTEHEILPGKSAQITKGVDKEKAFDPITFKLSVTQPEGLSDLTRTVVAIHPESETKGLSIESGDLRLIVSSDGSGARIQRSGKTVAFLAPLLSIEGHPPYLNVSGNDNIIECITARNTKLKFHFDDGELQYVVESDEEIEGPAVRVPGTIEQGLLPGVEHLGKGERSSSDLDLTTPEHIRYAPDPLWITMPLMVFVTDRVSIAMTWDDMRLQPIFATPNFFDGTADSRMSLRGTKFRASIRVSNGFAEGTRLEDAILSHVRKAGLPPVPKPPRTESEQFSICMKALDGALRNDDGWGHCVEDRWPREFYAGHASAIWRMTGQAPETPRLVGGGTHEPNDAIYFVTGRAQQWLDQMKQQAKHTAASQKPDGSFRYAGKFREGHFEDTASGFCARPAMVLLRHHELTGDRESLDAGLRALEYMKRFRTPRGGQVWEIPLHTPDILGSAFLTQSYVLGFRATGKKEYLDLAKRWALSGLPFVYQWTSQPVMLYATIPVLGATNWVAPNWIGLPVQWCGLDYAYALTELAKHDSTLDWLQVARGITIAGEQMQYPDGPHIGCLPDSFDLKYQSRRPWDINPCVLVQLRLRLAGRLDALAVAVNERHRVVSPFPVELRGARAIVRANANSNYQIVADGNRVIEINSNGVDEIDLSGNK